MSEFNGKSEYFDRIESVCHGAKIVQWFGNVTKVLAGADLPLTRTVCMKCSQPCETRLNAEYRETAKATGDQEL